MSKVFMRPLTWVFDLDNTLHDTRPHVMPHIDRAMTRYVAQHLDLDDAAANALRARYVRTHGATLRGLMHHHGTDPRHFLWHTHQFDDLGAMLRWEPGLRRTLGRLPGRRIVYSNAPLFYIERVLEHLGIATMFQAVYSIESVGFHAKPAISGFRAVLSVERLQPARSIMVEDSIDNLRTAKRLGMRTVWVERDAATPRHVDLKVRTISQLARRVGAFGL